MNLHQPLHVLPGVGPKSAEKYAKLGIENLQDLLLYFPFRYEDLDVYKRQTWLFALKTWYNVRLTMLWSMRLIQS